MNFFFIYELLNILIKKHFKIKLLIILKLLNLFLEN
jgi:hypothetical protein